MIASLGKIHEKNRLNLWSFLIEFSLYIVGCRERKILKWDTLVDGTHSTVHRNNMLAVLVQEPGLLPPHAGLVARPQAVQLRGSHAPHVHCQVGLERPQERTLLYVWKRLGLLILWTEENIPRFQIPCVSKVRRFCIRPHYTVCVKPFRVLTENYAVCRQWYLLWLWCS
jgi:hypothetical protein